MSKLRPQIPRGSFLRYDRETGTIQLVGRDGVALAVAEQQKFFSQISSVTLETLKASMSRSA